VLPGFRRWQADREVSGHKHCWSEACGQAGSAKSAGTRAARMSVGTGGSGPRDQLLQPGHRRLPARRRPPGGRRRRGALQPASSTQGLAGLGDRLLLAAGFLPAEISHSGTNLSDRGFGALLRHPGVRLNLDLVRQVERLGRLAPGREIGLRLNPRAGAFSERTRSAARVRGTGPAGEVRHRRPRRAARPCPAAAPAALGYGQIDPRGAELLFQIIERASIPLRIELLRREVPRLAADFPGPWPARH